MAQFCMPMLIVNMGGEMVYILEQRLTAQNVAGDKSKRGTRTHAARRAALPRGTRTPLRHARLTDLRPRASLTRRAPRTRRAEPPLLPRPQSCRT